MPGDSDKCVHATFSTTASGLGDVALCRYELIINIHHHGGYQQVIVESQIICPLPHNTAANLATQTSVASSITRSLQQLTTLTSILGYL